MNKQKHNTHSHDTTQPETELTKYVNVRNEDITRWREDMDFINIFTGEDMENMPLVIFW